MRGEDGPGFRWRSVRATALNALAHFADSSRTARHVRFVPIGDISLPRSQKRGVGYRTAVHTRLHAVEGLGNETSPPPTISASRRGRCRAAGNLAGCLGTGLSDATDHD